MRGSSWEVVGRTWTVEPSRSTMSASGSPQADGASMTLTATPRAFTWGAIRPSPAYPLRVSRSLPLTGRATRRAALRRHREGDAPRGGSSDELPLATADLRLHLTEALGGSLGADGRAPELPKHLLGGVLEPGLQIVRLVLCASAQVLAHVADALHSGVDARARLLLCLPACACDTRSSSTY